MDEIRELQRQLAQVQVLDTVHRLNERNIIEIINKCKAMGILEVLYTSTGKEYITPKQLEIEIQDELLVRGGRVNLVDLPPALTMDLTHIENSINDLLRKDSSLTLIQGELLANYYLDSIAEEMNDSLQESGQVSVTELAKRFQLPTPFIEKVVQDRLNDIVQGKLRNGVLYTEAFVQRQVARVRGVLTAITKPTPIGPLQATYKFDSSLYNNIVDDLLNEGRIVGSIVGRADRAEFTPDSFSRMQKMYIDNFFKQNGYIEDKTLTKMQINDPKSYMQKTHGKDAVYLSTFSVHKNLLNTLSGTVEETLASDQFIDIMTLMPPPTTEEDAFVLLQKCPAIQKLKSGQGVMLADRFIASKKFMSRVLEVLQKKVKEESDKGRFRSMAVQASGGKDSSAKPTKNDDWSDEDDGGKKKRGGKKRVTKVKEEPESDEDTGGKKGKGGKKGGKKSAGGSSKKEKGNTSQESSGANTLTDDEIRQCLEKNVDDVDDEFAELLAEHVKPNVASMCEIAAREVTIGNQAEQRKKQQVLLEKITIGFVDLQLYCRALSDYGDSGSTLEKHLLKTYCSDLLNQAVEFQALYHNPNTAAISSPEERQAALPNLPKDVSRPFKDLGDITASKSLGPQDFVEKLLDVCDSLDLRLRPLDKKKEKLALFQTRQKLAEQLKEQSEPVLALHTAIMVAYATAFNGILVFPGRYLPSVVNKLQSKMESSAFDIVKKYSSLVAEHLKNPDEPTEELQSELPSLKHAVLNMKKSNDGDE